jgi:hypothetical protein
MSRQPISPEAADALAEAYASIDGKLDAYRRERDTVPEIEWDDPTFTGHYLGYLTEAEEMIERLRLRGFDVTPLPALFTGGQT